MATKSAVATEAERAAGATRVITIKKSSPDRTIVRTDHQFKDRVQWVNEDSFVNIVSFAESPFDDDAKKIRLEAKGSANSASKARKVKQINKRAIYSVDPEQAQPDTGVRPPNPPQIDVGP